MFPLFLVVMCGVTDTFVLYSAVSCFRCPPVPPAHSSPLAPCTQQQLFVGFVSDMSSLLLLNQGLGFQWLPVPTVSYMRLSLWAFAHHVRSSVQLISLLLCLTDVSSATMLPKDMALSRHG